MSSNSPSTFCPADDEHLLLLARSGNETARSLLTIRYFRQRHKICRHASSTIVGALDDWEINEAFFRGYLEAETSYRFGRVTFYTFVMSCVKFAMANLMDKKLSKTAKMIAYDLDTPLETSDESTFTLADIIQENESSDDPRVFHNYASTLASLSKLPQGISKIAVEIAGKIIDGFHVNEIAELFKMSEKRVSYHFSRYRKWAKQTLLNIGVLQA